MASKQVMGADKNGELQEHRSRSRASRWSLRYWA